MSIIFSSLMDFENEGKCVKRKKGFCFAPTWIYFGLVNQVLNTSCTRNSMWKCYVVVRWLGSITFTVAFWNNFSSLAIRPRWGIITFYRSRGALWMEKVLSKQRKATFQSVWMHFVLRAGFKTEEKKRFFKIKNPLELLSSQAPALPPWAHRDKRSNPDDRPTHAACSQLLWAATTFVSQCGPGAAAVNSKIHRGFTEGPHLQRR